MKKTIAFLTVLILIGTALPIFGASTLSDDEISKSNWSFDTSSTNANNGIPAEVPESVIDGNTDTHWHSMINPKALPPHYITVILPEKTYISGYRYYPRTDCHTAGICTKYEIYVSEDGKNFVKAAYGLWDRTTDPKTVKFRQNVLVKAVKLVMAETVGGYGSAGEIGLLAPDVNNKNVAASKLEADFKETFLKPVLFDGMRISCTGKSAYDISCMADGESSSYWHTEMVQGSVPQDIFYKFTYEYTISGLRYVPRQDGNLTGHFKSFEVYISDDGENYNFVKGFTINEIDSSEKDFIFDSTIKAKYLKIHVSDGLYGYGTCADMYFLQTEKQYEEDMKNDEESYTLRIGENSAYIKKEASEKTITLDTAPFIYGGSTMIPLRGLLEEMGLNVSWSEVNQTIEATCTDMDIKLRIEDDRVYINGNRYNAYAAPMIRDSRTFVPLRFMSEQMGYNVYWDGETKTVKISTK